MLALENRTQKLWVIRGSGRISYILSHNGSVPLREMFFLQDLLSLNVLEQVRSGKETIFWSLVGWKFPAWLSRQKNFLGLNPTNSLLACIYKLVNGNLFKCSLTQFVHACLLYSFVFKSEDKSERVEFEYTCNYKLLLKRLVFTSL